MRATEGMIAILVGAILVFSVIIPMVQNATDGSSYTGQSETNTTTAGNLIQLFNATGCDSYSLASIQHAWNSTGDDVTSVVALTTGTRTGISWTNATTYGSAPASLALTLDYRCYDGAYITDTTARNITDILLPLSVVLIIVAISAMIYMKRD